MGKQGNWVPQTVILNLNALTAYSINYKSVQYGASFIHALGQFTSTKIQK